MNIFWEILWKPNKTLRYINDTDYTQWMYLLLFLFGTINSIYRAIDKSFWQHMNYINVIVIAALVWWSLSILYFKFFAMIVSFVGNLLGWTATTKDVLRNLTYACMPMVFTWILLTINIILFWQALFQKDFNLDNYNSLYQNFFIISVYVNLFIFGWSIRLMIKWISIAQDFGILRWIINFIFTLIIIWAIAIWLGYLFV